MTIVDHQIRQLCRTAGLVEPFNPDQVNPASYDVTLGSKILVESEPIYRLVDWDHPGKHYMPMGADGKIIVEPSADRWTKVDITDEPYLLKPSEFILAATEEYIRVPPNMECVFNLKSSRGREGYEHLMAAYIDPGFHGNVTLELVNVNRFHELPLFHGMRIGQLRFAKVDQIPMRNYAVTGRYHLDKGPQLSKG